MAFRDGMNAISKVLMVISIGIGILFFIICSSNEKIGDKILFAIIGIILFLLFGVPAWIIKKFAQ